MIKLKILFIKEIIKLMNNHNWTYAEDYICCLEYLAYVFDNCEDESMEPLVNILSLKLPQIKRGSIRMKIQNIKQVALDTGLEDGLKISPLTQYSMQCKRAFSKAGDDFFSSKERMEHESPAQLTGERIIETVMRDIEDRKTVILSQDPYLNSESFLEKKPKNLMGATVRHKKFGDGKVVNIGGDSITVKFPTKSATFLYPDSIGTHLEIIEFGLIDPPKSKILNRLTDDDFGCSAHDAYGRLSRIYDWDASLAPHFERKRLLYAKTASPEGYSVWFVAHSNFISDEDTTGVWKNTFEKDSIIEEWLPPSKRYRKELLTDNTKRIVFVKKASGKYYFMGIYEPISTVKNGIDKYTRTYKRVSDTYPKLN